MRSEPHTVAYGGHDDQVGDLRVPGGAAAGAGWPVVVLVHGGFWREAYRRDLMTPLADDLVARGYASWNVEYRRVGGAGGWPTTLTDVAASVDHLAAIGEVPLDLDRVAIVGHSAGGHLALWVAGRSRLPSDAPGAGARVEPCAVVAQAAVADLATATELSGGAVLELLGGGPDTHPERYAVADPVRLVGHRRPVLLAHGRADDTVPVSQSERYLDAARAAGDPAELLVLPGGHFDVIDPGSELWAGAVDFLAATC